MLQRSLFALVFTGALLISGCAWLPSREGHRRERTMRMSIDMQQTLCEPIKLRYDRRLAGAGEYDAHDASLIRLEYPRDLGAVAAEDFTRKFESAMQEVWNRHGLVLVQRVLIQLFPIRCWPASINAEARWRLPRRASFLPVPLPILPNNSAASEEAAGLTFVNRTIFTIVHELASYSLATSERGAIPLDEARFWTFEPRTATRWFSDGAATLAASEVCVRLGLPPFCYRKEGEEALARMGAAVFDWRAEEEEDAQFSELDFHNAAFEIVARIADASPEGGLRALAEAFRSDVTVDHARLEEAIRGVTGKSPSDFLTSPTPSGNGSWQ